ncbi:hypothetical protein KY285_011534 [Solanum tuberosum]|nr:hypothetical protein KY285_011534 [Solanum tuberosum]
MTILMAFQTPEVEVIGLATIFGNVTTKDATRNALLLCEAAGYPDVPVVEGSSEPLKRGEPRVADFVHGSVGLGNLFLPSPNSKIINKSASEFLVEKVSEYPGEMPILALIPLTNLALEMLILPQKQMWVISFPMGLLTKQIYGDPEAADVVFTWGANIDVVGINITTQVKLKDADLEELKQSKGKHAKVDINTPIEDEERIIECEKVPSCRVGWKIMACPLAA